MSGGYVLRDGVIASTEEMVGALAVQVDNSADTVQNLLTAMEYLVAAHNGLAWRVKILEEKLNRRTGEL
jgi:hypothetical protein